MTPSVQSYFFRLLSRGMAAYLASKDGIDEWRRLAASRVERPSVPSGVQLQQERVGDIPVEWLTPAHVGDAGRVILFLHGGAWFFGWYNSHRMLLGRMAKQTGKRALAVDYRLAPENPFPAALEDCLAAYCYLLECGIRPEQIAMAGDSAGGNLVITCMLALRDAGEPLPAAGVCISPATDLAMEGRSFAANAKKDALVASWLFSDFAYTLPEIYGGGHDVRDPLISPVYADLHGLPPLLVQAGGDEMLLSSITAFVDEARQDGVDVTYEVWPAMWHGWHVFAPYLPEAKRAMDSACRYIDAKLA